MVLHNHSNPRGMNSLLPVCLDRGDGNFFNENVWISIEISREFVPKGPINSIPALVQIIAWRRSGDKPLSEPMMVSLPTHICVTRPQWVKPILRGSIDSDEYDNVRSIRRVLSVYKVHYNNGESGM